MSAANYSDVVWSELFTWKIKLQCIHRFDLSEVKLLGKESTEHAFSLRPVDMSLTENRSFQISQKRASRLTMFNASRE